MNIHVVRPDGSWYSRPDVTLVRDADRFCLPDDCTGALACRACCVRIEKSGKAVLPQFAGRYFADVADSILFYGVCRDGAVTPSLDRATWVDRTFRSAGTLDAALQERIVRALETVSRHLSLRIGDFLILELAPPAPCRRGDTFDSIEIL